MPHSSQWTSDCVTNKFWGFLSGDEFAASTEDVAAHPDFDHLRYIVNDLQDVTGHDIRQADIERVAASRLGSMWTNPRVCVVLVTQDPGLAALADMTCYPILAGSQETVVFATTEEASAWIECRPTQWSSRPLVI